MASAPDAPLPIIDFTSFSSTGTPESRLATAKALTAACQETGFVYIVNHSVSPDLLEEAFAWTKRLFDLRTDEKMLAPHPPGPKVHRGYSWPGLEKVSQVLGDEEDVEKQVDALRGVKDCKVCLHCLPE
jgi:isopenicillin N synthase-like dioxygenase